MTCKQEVTVENLLLSLMKDKFSNVKLTKYEHSYPLTSGILLQIRGNKTISGYLPEEGITRLVSHSSSLKNKHTIARACAMIRLHVSFEDNDDTTSLESFHYKNSIDRQIKSIGQTIDDCIHNHISSKNLKITRLEVSCLKGQDPVSRYDYWLWNCNFF